MSSIVEAREHNQLPAYHEIQAKLAAAGIGIGPSEAHALVCGLICGDAAAALQLMRQELCSGGDLHAHEAQEGINILTQIHAKSSAQLKDPAMGFRLLLPEEEMDSRDRAMQLVNWCQGFLFGFGISAARSKRVLSAMAQESLFDIGEFTRLDIEAVDAVDEEQRRQISDLEEHLRVAVLTIYEDSLHDQG
jgi:uncharacterized protein YgfB (UPF0149 family)